MEKINYRKQTDVELIELIGGKDEKAFNEIYRRYQKALYIFIIKNYKLEPEACEEIVNDAWTKINKAFINKQYKKEQSKVVTYLYTAAKRLALDYIRKHNAQKREFERNTKTYETEEWKTINPISEEYDDSIDLKIDLVFKALQKQRPKNILVVTEILKGFKHEEIAERNNLPFESVRIIAFRAKEQIRKELKIVL